MKVNILVVEDEKKVRDSILSFIEELGCYYNIVGSASNGYEAIKFFKSQTIHILLTDLRMPKMDGFELIRKAYERSPETKMIILSGYDDFEYARRAMRFGVKDYLLKPIEREELNKALVNATSSLFSIPKNMLFFVNQEKWDMRLIRLEAKLLDAVEIGNVTAAEEALERLLLGFQQKVNEDRLRFIPFIVDTLTSLRKRLSSIDTVQLYFDQEIDSLLSAFEPQNSLEEINQRVKQFIIYCVKTVNMCRQQSCPDILFNCKKILDEQYKLDLTLTMIAQMVGVTPSYLSRLFKKEVGINFVDYLQQIRINKAKDLLNIPNMKILEVSEMVGFNNAEYFSRIFKRFTGITPQNYRSQSVKEE
ncbi:response regulator [Bacillus sp. FJAT-50079]|uniref:response regulator transcription factor n=1 Tax=Bacillus sp. FJAT-50079 TaxID=2833577 RepID=UPI001BCA4DF8|nr:response regulator [Bacillus sp. FJAT-50079]MBS4210496.1 response regulator [Bacillus sp. FJAT-50079]